VVKFLEDLQDSRYYTFFYVSVLKIVCFFCIMLLATHSQFGSLGDEGNFPDVEDLFERLSDTFSWRYINVTNVTDVSTMFTDVGKKIFFFQVPAVNGREIQ
jgi:hypothetical protein